MTAAHDLAFDYDPIVGLPPDLVDEHEDFTLMSESAPIVWHLPRPLWEAIWKKGFTGKGERIAILDTGCNAHVLLPTPVAERSFISGQSPRDPRSGHGTHCAGTALGRGGIGVAPEAELLVGKVLSDGGSGSSSGIAAGINWAIDQGATIISMSLGGGSSYEPTRQAIQRANEAGILVCASAGNSGQRLPRNTIGFPGRHLESYCSGSMDQQGRISSFSSAGREMDGVTPGSQIVSCSNGNRNGYRTMSGTSMSCPFAAGLFACVRTGMAMAGLPRLGGIDDWRPWLQRFFIDQGPSGHDPTWGWGMPDYRKIVDMMAQPQVKFV
jgi:subtilisin family serine protease